jgi:hypothetical protein
MYIIIVILFIIILLILRQELNPFNKTNNKSYANENDDISTLLDRIEWSALREDRVSWKIRYLVWSFIISWLSCMIILENTPKVSLFLKLWFIIWFAICSLHGFFYWHADKFTDYNIIKNTKNIRKKLNLSMNKNLSVSTKKDFKGSEEPWTFIHHLNNDFI